jgi:uncharacterized protein YcfJ
MLTKKTLSTLAVGALFAAATPAFADPPRWVPAHGHRDHERQVLVERHHFHQPVVREVVVRRPVVVQRTVVVERPVYYGEPAYSSEPVYAASVPGPALGTIGGAIIGGALGHQIGKGDGRDAATIVGAVIGGILGSGRY